MAGMHMFSANAGMRLHGARAHAYVAMQACTWIGACMLVYSHNRLTGHLHMQRGTTHACSLREASQTSHACTLDGAHHSCDIIYVAFVA
eukprot:356116-Chlamydomonas_euryale.AAC.10